MWCARWHSIDLTRCDTPAHPSVAVSRCHAVPCKHTRCTHPIALRFGIKKNLPKTDRQGPEQLDQLE